MKKYYYIQATWRATSVTCGRRCCIMKHSVQPPTIN